MIAALTPADWIVSAGVLLVSLGLAVSVRSGPASAAVAALMASARLIERAYASSKRLWISSASPPSTAKSYSSFTVPS